MSADDYEHGVLNVLTALTVVGDISRTHFSALISKWNTLKARADQLMYNPVVITNGAGDVVATGMLLVEEKLIHECGLVGHIEDIAVREDQQGKQLGKILIDHLSMLGKTAGCYKVILDCDEKNVGFYEKCGYKRAGVEMQMRL